MQRFLVFFRNRVDTKNLAEIIKETKSGNQDIICTRILWLSGLEAGINKGNNVDSYSRYIYIHGTNEEDYWVKKLLMDVLECLIVIS